MWLTFSPIPNIVADFYHVTVNDVDWFSTSYFVASLIIGFISIAILDVFGLRSAVGLHARCVLEVTGLNNVIDRHWAFCVL